MPWRHIAHAMQSGIAAASRNHRFLRRGRRRERGEHRGGGSRKRGRQCRVAFVATRGGLPLRSGRGPSSRGALGARASRDDVATQAAMPSPLAVLRVAYRVRQGMPQAALPTSKPAPGKPGGGDKPRRMSAVSWILLALLLGASWAYQSYAAKEEATPEIRYSDLYALLDAGKVESVMLKGPQVNGKLKTSEKVDGHSITTFRTLLPAMQ